MCSPSCEDCSKDCIRKLSKDKCLAVKPGYEFGCQVCVFQKVRIWVKYIPDNQANLWQMLTGMKDNPKIERTYLVTVTIQHNNIWILGCKKTACFASLTWSICNKCDNNCSPFLSNKHKDTLNFSKEIFGSFSFPSRIVNPDTVNLEYKIRKYWWSLGAYHSLSYHK